MKPSGLSNSSIVYITEYRVSNTKTSLNKELPEKHFHANLFNS